MGDENASARETRGDRRGGILEVAKLAGVSASTVSRVVNGRTSVDPALAERVRAAAAELGYRASPVARSLVLGRTQTVAVVVPDLSNPAFQGMLHGITRAAARDGYRVLVADSAEDVDDEASIARETRMRCDAIILCSPRTPLETLAELAPTLEPVVLVNRRLPGSGVPSVAVDYADGVERLAAHLAGLGHRRIAYLAGVRASASDAVRREGLARFAAAHADVEIITIETGVGLADGGRVADEVLDSGVTGVLAFNDLVAVGLMRSLVERGVPVPGEVSITGFDDIPFAAYTTPALTTAEVPVDELGDLAWQRLAAVLGGTAPDADEVLAPELRLRDSTGPRRAEPPRGR
ncbi:LacI family DNA-binding transcriptional regulator [Agromyces sp. NPDC058110]|uniref:LacI family DNA-binding transcriptional regulator n=1 Tax=Agromyces sp. NPDC058110 TaxID=3346345 RepID=UPI0036DD6A4E